MHLLRRDAQFGAEAEHTAVGEAGRGVDHDDGGVDVFREAFDRAVVLGEDRLGVVGRIRVDVRDRVVDRVDDAHADLEGEVFGAPIGCVGLEQFDVADVRFADDAVRDLVGVDRHMRVGERLRRHRQERLGHVAVHDELFGRVAHADTLRLGVEQDRDGLGQVGGTVHVDVHVAGTGLDDGHLGVAHHGLDEARAAAGHEQVDMPSRLHERGGAFAPVRVHGVDEGRVEMQLGEHVLDDRERGRVGALGRVAAAQQGRVAGFDAQRHHVHGDIGTRLVDHADHTHRHAHLLQAQTVGGLEAAHDLPHRVGQRGHMAHVLGRGRDARHVEFEPVELARVHAFVEAWLMSSAFAAAISSARASSASAIAASRPFFTSVVDFARARCASAARSAIAHTASNTPPDT